MSETYNRALGIHAVIELQLFIGIEESPEDAAAGWDAMSGTDKHQTTLAHKSIIGGFDDKVAAEIEDLYKHEQEPHDAVSEA